MTPYWLALFLAACVVMSSLPTPSKMSKPIVIFIGFAFVLFVGLRYDVGGDWGAYKTHLALIKNMSLLQALTFGDPGYYFLNWLASALGGNIAIVNTVCAIIVIYGLSRFASEQPFPALAYLAAVPYLIIVVAMGYTRQSAALGFAMVALAELANSRTRHFVFWIILGALFHKSAVLLLPIAAVSASTNRLWTSIWVGAIGLMAVNLLLLDTADDLWTNYVEAGYKSQGGLIRVAMNAVPSIIFLLYRNQLSRSLSEKRLWCWMSIVSIATIPLVLISSTAVDRVALYFIPVQLFLFSRLPYLSFNRGGFQVLSISVIGYYALVQFVWLLYAAHSSAWLPYDNYLFHGFSPPENHDINCTNCLNRFL